MSLINKMLKDLETRERDAEPVSSAKLYDDVQPVSAPPREARPIAPFVVLGLLVVVVGAMAYFIFGPRDRNTADRNATPAPAAVALNERKPDVAPLAVQAPSGPVSEPAISQTVAETKPKKTEIVRLAPAAPVPAPPKAKKEQEQKPATPPATATVVAVAEAKTIPKPAASKPPVSESSAESAGVVEKRDRVLSPEEKADAYYRDAGALIGDGKPEDARATLQAALAAMPTHLKARELAAALAVQTGRSREAQVLLQEGIRLAPQHTPFVLLLARLQVEQGGEAQAIATLEAARAAAVDDAGYLSFLAALYQRGNRHADAVKTYHDALALRPQDARAWLGLAISLEGVQDVTGAAEAYNRALQTGLDAQLARYAEQRLATLKK